MMMTRRREKENSIQYINFFVCFFLFQYMTFRAKEIYVRAIDRPLSKQNKEYEVQVLFRKIDEKGEAGPVTRQVITDEDGDVFEGEEFAFDRCTILLRRTHPAGGRRQSFAIFPDISKKDKIHNLVVSISMLDRWSLTVSSNESC